jgi:ABC-type sugar transport system ATPase subunit
MNLIRGEIAGNGSGPRFRSPHLSLALPEPFAAVAPGPVTLGIRPEHIRVCPNGDGADLDLPVRLVEPLGKDTLLYFDLGSERPFVVVSEGLALAELDAGNRVGLNLLHDHLFLFAPDGRRLARAPAAAAAPSRIPLAAARERRLTG